MRTTLRLMAIIALLGATMLPAGAITNGEPDGNDHPQVGELLFYVPDAIDTRFNDPGAWFTCTGTLIDDTTVLTAGHCTFAVGFDGATTNLVGSPLVDTNGDGSANNGTGGNDIWINFDEAPNFSILPPSSSFAPDDNGLRYIAWTAALSSSNEWTRGTAYPHPNYNDLAFVLADLGIVELDSNPGVGAIGELPTEGYLDNYLATPRNENRFTPVGYGLNAGFPTFFGGDVRENANVMLVSLEGTYGIPAGTSVVFSGNPGLPHTGGTCFGDSGGPVFEGDTNLIVAVTSFGVTLNCVEPGGYYRIDQPDDIEFINGFLGASLSKTQSPPPVAGGGANSDDPPYSENGERGRGHGERPQPPTRPDRARVPSME